MRVRLAERRRDVGGEVRRPRRIDSVSLVLGRSAWVAQVNALHRAKVRQGDGRRAAEARYEMRYATCSRDR